ncbi:MAG: vWA domain-containing protein [Nannocystaceae bacterium]
MSTSKPNSPSPSQAVPDLGQLFQSAHQDGVLSGASMQVLTVADLGAQIQAGLGVGALNVQASEVVLVALMPDDSGSIRFSGNTEVVRQGHNMVLESLRGARQSDTILVHTRYLNGEVLNPFCPLDAAQAMDRQNYNPSLGTPLYDQAVTLLGTMIAKAQEFMDQGVMVRTVTLLITDGSDQHSCRQKARDVAKLVRDMEASECHTVAAMGIADGSTDFRQVFREMGIRDQWMLTPGKQAREIRRAFQVFSQSAVQVSQGKGNLGGFMG